MEKRNKIIIIAISFALVLLFSGLTYAYFTSATSSESASTIVAKGGSMNIRYDNKSANITVSNIYPREEAWVNKKFQVIGNNTTDLDMIYKVKMIVDNNRFGLDLSYTLTGTNTSNSGKLIPNVTTNTPIGTAPVTLGKGYHTKGTNKIHEYTLQIYFKPSNENQNYAQQAKFAAHLVIETADKLNDEPPKNWNNAGSNTLLAGIKKNYAKPTEPLTKLVNEGSSEKEAIMGQIPDDYGISYYFRGNVQNNYVRFAGMCWRIVRITGDGSVKLALYNYSSTNCTQTGDNLAFARYSGTTYITKFNNQYDDNAYIGFMYGTPKSNTYAATHANINKSTILQNLETWYKSKLTAYTDKLADTIWCNDKSTSDPGYNENETNYYNNNNNYSLICPNDNNGGKLSKLTVNDTIYGNGNLDYKIGLLTANELLFSGYCIDYSRYTSNASFLLANTSSGGYWTLSPYNYMDVGATIMNGFKDGYFGSEGVLVDNTSALRPAIALKSDTTISGGNGTASSPFVIN